MSTTDQTDTDTALTGDTGEHVTITPAPTHQQVHIHLPDWVRRECDRLATTGGYALAAAGMMLVAYVFVEWLTEVGAPVTVLLLTVAAVVGLVGGDMRVRARTSRLHAEVQIAGVCRVKREMRTLARQLADQVLPGPEVPSQPSGDDRYLAGYADGLAGRTLGQARIVPMNGNRHPGD